MLENPPFMDDFPIETSIYKEFFSQPCLMTPEGRKVDPDITRDSSSARITMTTSRLPPAQLSGGTSLDLHVAATPTTTVPRPFCRF